MFTEREAQVMALFDQEWRVNQIARELHISVARVAQIRQAATRKLYRYYIGAPIRRRDKNVLRESRCFNANRNG